MDQRRGTTAPDSSQTFGLGKEIIIIWSGIALFFFVCGFHQIIRNQQPFMFFPIALVLLFLIAGHLRVRIILNPDHIRVRKMFGSWQLNYSDITSVCMGGFAWSGSAFTKDVLYLHTKDGLRDINPSLFSNSDLAKVFDALESHNLRIKTINAWMCRYTVKKIREEQRKEKRKRLVQE